MHKEVLVSKRIRAISDITPISNVVADIGCDHGKVLYLLLKNKKCNYVIGSDISEACVTKAKQLLINNGYSNFDIRVGDGVNTLTQADNVDTIVIAGMGGLEIMHILAESKLIFKNYILQPMSNVNILRKWLVDNGYCFITDIMIKDKGKYYDMISCNKGKKHYSKMDIMFGKDNFDNPIFMEYAMLQINKYQSILQGITTKKNRKPIMQYLKQLDKAVNKGVKNGTIN